LTEEALTTAGRVRRVTKLVGWYIVIIETYARFGNRFQKWNLNIVENQGVIGFVHFNSFLNQ
jgi:hypothetical protein